MADKFSLQAIITAVDKLTPSLKNIRRAAGLTRKTVRDLGGSSRQLFGSLGALMNPVTALLGAGGLAGVGAAVGKVVGVSAEFERFRTVLETVEGSAAKARSSMQWVSDFAVKTPYELAEVTDAFVKLKAYGIEPQSGALQSAGDAAAAMNKTIGQAVEALADAMTGENERLKEFGIVARKTGNEIVYTWVENGKTMAAKANANNKAMIQSTLTGIWNRRYGGAMDKLSRTWDGMWSNIKDSMARVMLQIGEAGLFDFLKGQMSGVLEVLDRMAKDGSLQRLATTISTTLVDAFKEMKTWAMSVDWIGIGRDIRSTASAIADVVRHLGGLKGVLIGIFAIWSLGPIAALLGIVGGLWRFAAGLVAIAGGWGVIGAAMLKFGKLFAVIGRMFLLNPIGLAITAIAGAAYLVYSNWDRIKTWFTDFFGWLTDKISGIGEWFKSMVPDWAIKLFGSESAAPVTAPASPMSRPGGLLGGQQRLNGEMTVRFENAPPGMRVSQGQTNQPGVAMNPDVGYRSLSLGLAP